MGVSLSGLVSNLDTDSIVAALVSGYTYKKDVYVKAQTKLEWKQDAWKELNTKIKKFYTKYLSEMRFSTAFNKKISSASGTKATVTASSNAVNGTQNLKINQLATSGYLTGGVVSKADPSDTKAIKGDTKLSELGIENGSKITINANGKEKTITVNASTTVNAFVVSLKESGVNASFDEKNQRFFVSSKTSGKDGEFSLIADNDGGSNALKAMGLALTTDADIENYRNYANMTDADFDTLIESVYTKQKTALYDIDDETTVKKLKEALKDEIASFEKQNKDILAANKTIDYRLAAIDTYETEYNVLTKEEQSLYMKDLKGQIKELNSKKELTQEEEQQLGELKAKQRVYTDLSEGVDIDEYKETLEMTKLSNTELYNSLDEVIQTNKDILADETDTLFSAYVISLNDNITSANDALKGNLIDYYTDKKNMAEVYTDAYDLVNTEGVDKTTQAYKDAAALLGSDQSKTGATRIVGRDAEIELNGAVFNSNSNVFQVNGLTITANALTDDDETITITTDTDTQGIYNMIKNFFTEFNTLINEMDKLYNADLAKGYEPLTDDEKDAMSETEVEKWEEKIKSSLLRRDSTLDSVSNTLKNQFRSVIAINGKNYSLSSFGIKTLSYFASEDNEKSSYHIDGDPDNSNTSGKPDKLMEAIASDPSTVAEFFNKLSNNVYGELFKKMQSTRLSSSNTIYNDKVMKREYNEYTDIIEKWEEKIVAYEAKYRKQFTAMEKALGILNSQQSQLAGFFG